MKFAIPLLHNCLQLLRKQNARSIHRIFKYNKFRAPAELQTLARAGPQYAARIIEYREKYGPFETPEERINVSGIGPKTFEVNKERIVVN